MPAKQYQKIVIACSDNIIEAFSNYLLERNTGGIVVDEDVTSGLTVLTAYIDPELSKPFSEHEIDSFYDSIKDYFESAQYQIINLENIPAEDWLVSWKKTFHPIHITNRIVACPSWEKYKPQPGEIVIIIDPKMAFGTGHHETTAQCMKALEKLDPCGKRILDYGCGTGLLAIAAVKLDADMVIAVDNDPEAVECARENIALNDVEIDLVESGDYIAEPPVDIIAANLNIGIIIELFAKLDSSLRPGGHVIFSGIPIEDKQRLLDFISDKPYDIIEEQADSEWISFIALKRGC
jgi:ribosomal protein L11 methyltransferase